MKGKADKHYIVTPHVINGVLVVWTDIDLQSIADNKSVPVLFFKKRKEDELE